MPARSTAIAKARMTVMTTMAPLRAGRPSLISLNLVTGTKKKQREMPDYQINPNLTALVHCVI